MRRLILAVAQSFQSRIAQPKIALINTPLQRFRTGRWHAICHLLVASCLLSSARASDLSEVLTQADRLEREGHFREAAAVLTHALAAHPTTPSNRKQLEFELDRLDRIRKDFPYTHDQLYSDLKKSVRDLTPAEYEQWIHEKRFDTQEIDGEQRFMASSVSNLFFRYPELYARRMPPKNSGAVETLHWETCQAIKAAALAEHRPYVLPKRFDVTMSVIAERNAAPDGEIIRAWLPIPREYPFQGEFELLTASPAPKHTDDAQSAIRSLYLEQTVRKNRPTKFTIEYDYTAQGVWFDIKPDEVRPVDLSESALAPFTTEAPHVVFTPELRALSQQIGGNEANPCLKARKFYDWISENIKYSFAIEYSTLRNISEYCRSRGYGDCGQEALLFITLCRLNGIPARWQSGWNIFPGAKSNHDWSEIYLAPYGWIPVDPYMGIYAMRYATTLKPGQRREIRDFYFGGLDQYRMSANSDHNQTLTPPKQSMRSDNVDFQRGELEWGSHNIYFDEFSYELNVKEVPKEPKRLD
jgi:transglutaminase-like putative cysteine protease